jgi:hypothetical protein
MPRHLCAQGDIAHPKSHTVEQFINRYAAFADHFRQSQGVGPVSAFGRRSKGSGCRIESDQHAWIRLDQGQASTERLALQRERMIAG